MTEYFDFSIIIDKNTDFLESLECFIYEKFHLNYGDNFLNNSKFKILTERDICVVLLDDYDDYNFFNLSIGFSNVKFNEYNFKNEIKDFIEIIEQFFKESKTVLYVLGSYEINEYLLRNITDWKDINNVLSKFPIVFVNNEIKTVLPNSEKYEYSTVAYNFNAQDIFTDFPIQFDILNNK